MIGVVLFQIMMALVRSVGFPFLGGFFVRGDCVGSFRGGSFSCSHEIYLLEYSGSGCGE